MEDEIELIPLMSKDEETKLHKQDIPSSLPILSLRNTVLFPGIVTPITAGRDKSIKLLTEAYKGDRIIGVLSQKDVVIEDPTPEDLFQVGTVARILRLIKLPDGNITVILQGMRRFKVEEFTEEMPYFIANVEALSEKVPTSRNKEYPIIIDSIRDLAYQIVEENPMLPSEAANAIRSIESKTFLINFVASNLTLTLEEKQLLLEVSDLKLRALEVMRFMNVELQKLELKNSIQNKVRKELDQQQKEYFLHQQIKSIQEELGGNTTEEEINEMRKKAKKKRWSEETANHFDKEINRLSRLNPQMPEHNIQRNYLEFMLDLPWNEYTKDVFDLKNAQKILDADHYGLEDVKERIIEHLAVLKLKGDMRSPILCLYGPPGVGKTSLGKSIAKAVGRKYIRMSLGGLHDES